MTVFGWDTSSWDATPASRDGIDVFTTKLTDGDHFYENPTAAVKLNAMRAFGCPVLGCYHVLWGDRSIPAQAEWFLSRLDAVVPWWRSWPYFVAQSDDEGFGYNGVPTVAQINQFGDELVARSGGAFLPTTHLSYAPTWQYGQSIAGLRYWWWSSQYGTNPTGPYRAIYPGDTSVRWQGPKQPLLLQYGSNAIIAGQTTSDANAYRGTLAQLQATLKPNLIQGESDMFILHIPAAVNPNGLDEWWLYDQYGRVDQKPNSNALRGLYARGGCPTVEITDFGPLPAGWTWARVISEFESQGATRYQTFTDEQVAAVAADIAAAITADGTLPTLDQITATVRAQLDRTRLTGA